MINIGRLQRRLAIVAALLVGILLSLVAASPAMAASNVQGISVTTGGYIAMNGAGAVAAFGMNDLGHPSNFSGGMVDVSATRDGSGYVAISTAGQVYAYGSVAYRGNPTGFSGVMADIAVTADGQGYVAVSSTGQVYAYGTVRYQGNPTGFTGSIVGISVTADGQGYAAISSSGQVYAYGTVISRGNPSGYRGLMVGISVTSNGSGYAAVSSAGQVYAYGAVRSRGNPYDFSGSVQGISVNADGSGYAVVTDQGQIHTFGPLTYLGDFDNVAIQGSTQHLNANRYVNWAYPSGGFWNVDQTISVVQKNTSVYWAVSWGWTATSGPANGGYMGLQTNGNRWDGSTGDTALFSLWGANGFRNKSGTCRTFTEGTSGVSCRMPYTIYGDGNNYRLRVWRLDSDSQGQWWGVWIKDSRRGDVELGELRVPSTSGLMTGPTDFAEYYGGKVACDSVPLTQANFGNPTVNGSAATAGFANSTKAACTGGSASQITNSDGSKAIRVILGGARPSAL